MSNTPPQLRSARLSPALIGAGVLIIALGFGLPLLTSGTAPNLPPPDPAAKQAAPAPIQPPDAPDIGAALFRLAVGLAVVCAFCVLVVRWVGPKPPPAPGTMEVLASIAVAQCVLHLVRAGDRRLLVGTDPAGVKAVVELPAEPALPPEPPEAPASPAANTAEPAPEPPPTEPLSREALLNLLLRLRGRADASR